jgi:hypothetical protein
MRGDKGRKVKMKKEKRRKNGKVQRVEWNTPPPMGMDWFGIFTTLPQELEKIVNVG